MKSLGILCGVLFCLVGGCAAEEKPQNKYVEKPAAVYEGLKGQSCAVMVWADWRTRTEYNQIQIDMAKLVTKKLEDRSRKDGKKTESPTIQFVNPASVVRYQREHPEVMSMPIGEVAPKLGAPRVIFIEFEDFAAHSPEAIGVLKGYAKATLRVLEVSGGVAKTVFEEADIHAHYPPDSPEGVIPSDKVNVRTIYDGTLELMAEKIVARFKLEH
jgi:hypothetical protein